jgi:outer membrane immunogenic protein
MDFLLGPVTGNTSGVLGGGQVGCNYQFAPNWVIGFEGEQPKSRAT